MSKEEFDLFINLKNLRDSLKHYETNYDQVRSLSDSEQIGYIREMYNEIIHTRVLNVAGTSCRRCYGSGIEPGT